MLLGIDLDNTIINYDDVFVALAREMRLVDPGFSGGKSAVRDAVRAGESGDIGWQRLQARAYGPDIGAAKLAKGVETLLMRARGRNVPVVIVSHKTEFSPYGEGTNLRAAALAWMAQNNLFDPEKTGLRNEDIFFESTRAEKIGRIKALGCTHFIDDLEEVFGDPSFPSDVQSYLYAPGCEISPPGRFRAFRNHCQIADRLFGVDPVIAAKTLCEAPILSIEPVGHGRNNRLYRVVTPAGAMAMKCYPSPDNDTRDRLRVEFGALEFLLRQGELSVPAPLRCSLSLNAATYEWIEGSTIGPGSKDDLDQVLDFAQRLFGYSRSETALRMPLASEACLSSEELMRQIERRQLRLSEIEAADAGLAGFMRQFRERFVALRGELGGRHHAEIAAEYRTLSPSDFGFHNALRRADARIVFVDFEYFGWDDPVKLTADLMLHPAMQFDDVRRGYIAAGMAQIFRSDVEFTGRLARMLPFYALRWCMIMLNEFLPERWSRRVVAGETGREASKARQLAKAEVMLNVATAMGRSSR